jgi:hypothetical protein
VVGAHTGPRTIGVAFQTAAAAGSGENRTPGGTGTVS